MQKSDTQKPNREEIEIPEEKETNNQQRANMLPGGEVPNKEETLQRQLQQIQGEI